MSRTRLLVLMAPLAALFCLVSVVGGHEGGHAGRSSYQPASQARLDLSAWEQLPVLERGRVMPLQTYARSVVEKICGRANPRLDLRHEVGQEEFDSQQLARARAIFPEGKERKFDASELLLSWLVERDAWEDVPFILAEHEELRTLIEVPLENDQQLRLRYVSPRQLADSDAFRDRVMELRDLDREARRESREFKPQGVDKLVAELWVAFRTYRHITGNPHLDVRSRGRFMEKAATVLDDWSNMSQSLAPLRQHAGTHELEKLASQLDAAQQAIAEAARSGEFKIEQVEPAVVLFVRSAGELENHLGGLQRQMLQDAAKWNEEQRGTLVTVMTQLSTRAKKIAKTSKEMHLALFDDGDSFKVVPALNAAALEKSRDVADEAQPWLSLQVVLHGSSELLRDYPTESLENVRHWFNQVRAAYTDRGDADRAAKFAESSRMFAGAMQTLAARIEPLRRALPIETPDEDLMRYTQYPEAGTTRHEVLYNRLDPFKWATAISLAAVVLFSLAFGVLRRPMTWAGLAVLLLGIGWTSYGFFLRVVITQWAPVTNMYETVVYVPLFISLLGAWFMLLPLTWNGLKAGWRMTALPGSFEAAPLEDEQLRLLSPERWQLAGLLLMVPRALLMAVTFWALSIAEYYDGGQTVLSLVPKGGFSQLSANFNALLVWVVGLLVLGVTTWYLPRAIVALATALATIVLDVRGRFGEAAEGVYSRKPFGLAAALVASFLYLVAANADVLDGSFSPLMPVLRSNFWLTIHVLTIVSSYGAGLLAWGLGLLALGYYLFGRYRVPETVPSGSGGFRSDDPQGGEITVTPRPPKQCDTLGNYCYKTVQVAVLLLAAGTILGGLWADVSWGRFWGWDPKEVFALVSLLVYLAVLHGRYAGLFGNFGLVFGTVLGATAIAMSWYGVNFVLGVGLHSYGFGEGGQFEVGAFIFLNWLFLGIASARYMLATQPITLHGVQQVEADGM